MIKWTDADRIEFLARFLTDEENAFVLRGRRFWISECPQEERAKVLRETIDRAIESLGELDAEMKIAEIYREVKRRKADGRDKPNTDSDL